MAFVTHLFNLSFVFQGESTDLIRYENENEKESASPHLVATQIDKCFLFDLRLKGTTLFGNINIVEGIAAFLHLAKGKIENS